MRLENLQTVSAWLCVVAVALGLSGADAGESGRLTLLSTQLRPIAEAQKLRNVILKDFARDVDFVTEPPQQLAARLEAEGRMRAVDVVGALHNELQPLVPLDAFVPLDDLAGRLTDRGMPDQLLRLSRFGTDRQLLIPWMQASYLMVANKAALPYLPPDANIDALSYDQLARWAAAIRETTGKRLLGFPAGPQGLMHRFFEGFLLPSYTGGVVVPFRSAAAEAMWARFGTLWQSVNPDSTRYNFMQQPLLSGDVWIAFDHVARVRDALRQKPDDFVVFPVPAGPKGRGYMPVLVALSAVKGTSDPSAAKALIDYLVQPRAQIATARNLGFFPVLRIELPADFDPGLKMAGAVIDRAVSATDALVVQPPTGLGDRAGDFDRVFMETFQFIVLRGQTPREVLDRQAVTLQRLIDEAKAPCWQPDPPSTGPCRVQ